METYLRTTAGNKCPICRADVEDGGHGGGQAPLPRTHTAPPQTSTAPQANGSANRPSCADQFRNEQTPSTATESDYVGHATAYETMGNYDTFYFARRAPSIRYRMDRMRTLYPDVMTYDLLRTLNSAVDRGSITDFRSHISARSVEVQQIMTRIRESTSSNAKRSGSLGRSRGFGGGRSSGGGGGRW